MKILKIMFFLVTIVPQTVYAFDIVPKWKENDEFIYKIEITDERPPVKNKRYINKSVFKVSLKVIKETKNSYILKWQYLPVKNPIIECFYEDKDSCYSWSNDIKQGLKLIVNATKEGTYHSVANPDEVVVQIGSIFDAYVSRNENDFKKWNKEAINRLRESVVYDDSIVRELLEYHSIYGNSVNNRHFDINSRIIQSANQSMSEHSNKIYKKNDYLIVEYMLLQTSFPYDKNGHLKEGKHLYSWVLNNKKMVVIEMKKDVELKTKEGTRKHRLRIKKAD
ncbi:MAG: hypothetical protein GY795_44095 [Desulfobacterales bacterium]|nr:hypothetical protein [Desulfobacterales bacterium]